MKIPTVISLITFILLPANCHQINMIKEVVDKVDSMIKYNAESFDNLINLLESLKLYTTESMEYYEYLMRNAKFENKLIYDFLKDLYKRAIVLAKWEDMHLPTSVIKELEHVINYSGVLNEAIVKLYSQTVNSTDVNNIENCRQLMPVGPPRKVLVVVPVPTRLEAKAANEQSNLQLLLTTLEQAMGAKIQIIDSIFTLLVNLPYEPFQDMDALIKEMEDMNERFWDNLRNLKDVIGGMEDLVIDDSTVKMSTALVMIATGIQDTMLAMDFSVYS